MTLDADSPNTTIIDAAIEHLECSTGRTPSALALARHLGLANTTFRRRYPDIVVRLRRTARVSTAPETVPGQIDSDVLRLRQRNRELADSLALAISNIQRLSIDNRSLRQQLEDAAAVTRLSRRP